MHSQQSDTFSKTRRTLEAILSSPLSVGKAHCTEIGERNFRRLDMQIRTRLVGEVRAGEECSNPRCPLYQVFGAHRHGCDVTLHEVHPDDCADELRARALGVDL
jgi:hypothetical protein